MALVIKAKPAAVDAGITVFEDEFLTHIVVPDNSTVDDFTRPLVEKPYSTSLMTAMLPALPEVRR